MMSWINCGKGSVSQVIRMKSVPLQSRQVSSNFLNNFHEKLVFVGQSEDCHEELETVINKWSDTEILFHLMTMFRSRRWKYVDLSRLRLTRWSLTRMSRMIYLETLILDDCHLQLTDLGFFGQVPTVKTLSLNKNSLREWRPSVRIISHTFNNISFLSLLGNPFQSKFNNDSEVAHYRQSAASKLKYLR